MKSILSQAIVAMFIVLASNSILFVGAGRTSEGGEKEVKEMLLSAAATCPVTCKHKDGKHCCT